MNSDPYDSAAWRTFGMLDADESAIFDEAMRHDPVLRSAYLEMDRLSAAVAAATTSPIEPRAGQLERLQTRLNLAPSRRGYLWLGISGWSAAALLAVALLLDRTGTAPRSNTATAGSTPAPREITPAPAIPANPQSTVAPKPREKVTDAAVATAADEGKPKEARAAAKVETKRLIQEIQVLRDNLQKFQHRDRVLFEAVPGMALPIVMRMNPPGMSPDESSALAKNEEHAPITAILGDALRMMTVTSTSKNTITADSVSESTDVAVMEEVPPIVVPEDSALLPEHPTAIPIYDAARDSGTLVVSNLPPAETGKVYNLWVNTTTGGKPIYVGSLPESSATGADSFDFSLGSNMVLPSGFVLTKDPQNAPATPTETNTILQGPPTPGR